MRNLLDKKLVRESIKMRIDDLEKDKERYKNIETILGVEGQIKALESLLASLNIGNFDWKEGK